MKLDRSVQALESLGTTVADIRGLDERSVEPSGPGPVEGTAAVPRGRS
jgi:hypothetical protein